VKAFKHDNKNDRLEILHRLFEDDLDVKLATLHQLLRRAFPDPRLDEGMSPFHIMQVSY